MSEQRGPRLELTWPNKDKFLLVPKDDDGKPVWVERDHPAASEVRLSDFVDSCGEVNDANPHADNLLFTGDSLDVLRIVAEVPEYRREYRGKVKLAYIDPPFNTGKAFEHYDDWMEHSTWLSFMRDRLLLIKELLSPDGTVWVHLDNYESHRMRCLMDEIFGASAFLSAVVWQRTTAKSKAQRTMGTLYDNILVYGKADGGKLRTVRLPYSKEYLTSKYSNSDDRGPYRLGDLTAPSQSGGGGTSAMPWRGYDPSTRGRKWSVPVIAGVTDHFPTSGGSQEKLEALLEAGYIALPRKEGGAPQFKRYLNPEGGVAVGDLWTDITVLNSQSKERTGYDTQKPEALLQRILQMGSDPGDIVLDCFAGSGTTAAVAHKMGRRWVTADILPGTVSGFTEGRLAGVIRGDTQIGVSPANHWTGGGGFRSVNVAPSMYEVTPYGVMLAEWATNGKFSRAVAGQLGFEWDPDGAPFCGVRGRMRLAVLDGAVGPEEVRQIVSMLGEKERVTLVSKVVLPGSEETLAELSKGSRIRKAPRDLLTTAAKRARRRTEGALS